MQHRTIPTDIILEMNKRGFSDFDIIRYLRSKRYTPVEINDAFNQAKIKLELSKNLIDQELQPEISPEKKLTFHEKQVLENVSHKLKNLEEKEKKQEQTIEELKEHLAQKIQEQSIMIKKLNAELNSLNQSFSKILEPLAHNVKIASGMLDTKEEVEELKETREEQEDKSKKPEKTKKKKEDPSLDDIF